MSRAPSLTWRLAALFAVGNALLVALLGFAIHLASDRHFIEQDRHDLHGRAMLVAASLERTGDDPSSIDELLVGHHEIAARLLAPGGQVRFARNDAVIAAMPIPTGTGEPVTFVATGSLWRGIDVRLPPRSDASAPAPMLRIAINIDHHARFLSMLVGALVAAGVSVSLLGVALGWLAARRGLSPLATIARRAAGVSASRLADRLDTSALPLEIRPLADELNAMLARLEDAFGRLAGFSSDIAHELRTPISNLMTATQVVLSQARDADTYRETLETNLDEFERMARMVNDMLFLAKADHGLVVPHREPVELAVEVDATIEFNEALAEARQVTVRRNGNAVVFGDRLMIRRALSNLLSNALRHAPAGTTIDIEVHADGPTATMAVANVGDPIPPDVLPRLFDRFYRADPARTGSADGAGLGLAIVRSIALAHGGTVSARRDGDRNRFSVELPSFAR